ncbi:NADP-dependent oxidoreductase [Streptomyces sp. H10-C2]|uniref:NADP-dependent oxidoreductase n=1 Tax=unclassified Streptomyces TaxID=2593676 RepID=UPI0024B966BE|nr:MULTISPECIES: NADP-dependent oxidoreductase [unclassified Streptomyces]MDJ0346877.1 NADP-dependent oxidoreductase [Streptomyces sp. PH10-H1]MDJ0375175.1 NADP-dependent oxidoreductase [Streptomyces sp. H10-C2]
MRALIARFTDAHGAVGVGGGGGTLEVADVPVPEVGAGRLRIAVEAAAVNPVDLFVLAGAPVAGGLVNARPSFGLGWDIAGTVDTVGPGVTAFAPGDQVIGLQDRLDVRTGAQADYVVLDATAVAPAPTGIPVEAAATLPLNALTADQALDVLGALGLTAGSTLLVTGAAGALGGYAVELAAHRGLRVVAVAGAADEAEVRAMGAAFFVERGEELADRVRALVPGGADGALDAAMLRADALDAVRGDGAFASVNAGAAPVPLRGIHVRDVWVRADGARLAELAKLAEDGVLTPRVAGVLPLEQAAEAHARMSEGGVRGRWVLVP